MRSFVMWAVEVIAIAAAMMVCLLIGLHYGEKLGVKKALITNPVSEELEMTCAGLWVGELNKKAAGKK